MRWPLPAVVVSIALFAVACGSDPAPLDAGPEAEPSDSGLEAATAPDTGPLLPMPAAPELPWLDSGAPPIAPPLVLPCPDGWRAVDSEGAPTTCDPYPADGPRACPAGEAHFPGEAGCVAVGTPCGADDWATDLPAGRRIVYVRAGASAGGDGTRARPKATIAEALSGLRVDIVALARGHYDEEVLLPPGTTLWGACTAETVISRAGFVRTGGVVSVPFDAEVRNLRIGPSGRIGIWLSDAGHLVLRDVVVEGAESFGIFAQGEGVRLEASSVVVRDTRAEVDPGSGYALYLAAGASAELSRAVFERSVRSGVELLAGTSLVMRDAAVLDTRAPARGRGFGIHAGQDARLSLERVLVAGSRGAGIEADGAELDLDDLVVRDNRVGDDALGTGISLHESRTIASRVVVERADTFGIVALGGATTLEDAVVRAIDHRPAFGAFGGGIEVGETGTMVGARWLVRGLDGFGLHAVTGATLVAEDVTVAEIRGRADGTGGMGLQVGGGAQATLLRLAVQQASDVGLYVRDPGSLLVLDHFVVRDTRAQLGGVGGEGAWIRYADAELRHGLFDGNRTLGLGVIGMGGRTVLEDLVVRDTSSSELDGSRGRGLELAYGSRVEATRTLFERNREWSVVALDGATGLLSDLRIRESLPAACAESSCPATASGIALSVSRQDGMATESAPAAHLEVERFALEGAALCGVQVSGGGELDLASGVVSGAAIGACLQRDDYDLARLARDVVYLDNGVNLQATSYPPPSPIDSAPAP